MHAVAPHKTALTVGFTLIELSVVLVIIGLIVGGIVVGRDLIVAAQVRAQISQIEKYNTAVNTFRGKYNYLPGDIPDPDAGRFGFLVRAAWYGGCFGGGPGQGDGNGIIQASWTAGINGAVQSGETEGAWVDLSTAGLIDGGFNQGTPCGVAFAPGHVDPTFITSPSIPQFWPEAKIGNGNYVAIWSGGWSMSWVGSGDSVMYFAIFNITTISDWGGCCFFGPASGIGTNPGPTVRQAYAIDTKVDDGLPQSGRVTAIAPLYGYAAWSGLGSGSWSVDPWTTATAGSATSCFDNSSDSSGTPGVAGAIQHYSLEINNGNGANCPISFRFQ